MLQLGYKIQLKSKMSEYVIPAVSAQLRLVENSLKVYRLLPIPQDRISAEDVALSLGVAKNFFFKKRQFLKERGGSGELIWVSSSGEANARTISIRDFGIFVQDIQIHGNLF